MLYSNLGHLSTLLLDSLLLEDGLQELQKVHKEWSWCSHPRSISSPSPAGTSLNKTWVEWNENNP